ncbi:hypothetical protein DFH27DRAFT_645275 [Peziza echinospora]|nr:hypothetical protein DFH27DRAFT_645275 [Peziza echinospora]
MPRGNNTPPRPELAGTHCPCNQTLFWSIIATVCLPNGLLPASAVPLHLPFSFLPAGANGPVPQVSPRTRRRPAHDAAHVLIELSEPDCAWRMAAVVERARAAGQRMITRAHKPDDKAELVAFFERNLLEVLGFDEEEEEEEGELDGDAAWFRVPVMHAIRDWVTRNGNYNAFASCLWAWYRPQAPRQRGRRGGAPPPPPPPPPQDDDDGPGLPGGDDDEEEPGLPGGDDNEVGPGLPGGDDDDDGPGLPGLGAGDGAGDEGDECLDNDGDEEGDDDLDGLLAGLDNHDESNADDDIDGHLAGRYNYDDDLDGLLAGLDNHDKSDADDDIDGHLAGRYNYDNDLDGLLAGLDNHDESNADDDIDGHLAGRYNYDNDDNLLPDLSQLRAACPPTPPPPPPSQYDWTPTPTPPPPEGAPALPTPPRRDSALTQPPPQPLRPHTPGPPQPTRARYDRPLWVIAIAIAVGVIAYVLKAGPGAPLRMWLEVPR